MTKLVFPDGFWGGREIVTRSWFLSIAYRSSASVQNNNPSFGNLIAEVFLICSTRFSNLDFLTDTFCLRIIEEGKGGVHHFIDLPLLFKKCHFRKQTYTIDDQIKNSEVKHAFKQSVFLGIYFPICDITRIKI